MPGCSSFNWNIQAGGKCTPAAFFIRQEVDKVCDKERSGKLVEIKKV